MEASNPYTPPSAPVRDMPHEGGNFTLASLGSRFGAFVLDTLIGILLTYVPYLIFVGPKLDPTNPESMVATMLSPASLMALLPGSLLYLGVTIWLEIKNRQTIGKKLLGIKVARTDGSTVGIGRLFWLRNVVVGLLTGIPIAGLVIFLIDNLLIFRASRKCLHDQIADTIVIKA